VGSNPTQSIESSVQIPTMKTRIGHSKNETTDNQIFKPPSCLHSIINYGMRDLYHRKEKLAYWINRINTDLKESDKTDVLKFIRYMQDKESSILWIVRCITALLLMRRQLGKSFKDANKEEIRALLKWMDDKNYKASTHEKFRRILKFYYKVVYGNNENYPEAVSWFSVNVGKEKHRKETNFDIAEYLEEEEIQNYRRGSFSYCCRPHYYLRTDCYRRRYLC
jgi:hypothetical protein